MLSEQQYLLHSHTKRIHLYEEETVFCACLTRKRADTWQVDFMFQVEMSGS